jgi:hypothetical protein
MHTTGIGLHTIHDCNFLSLEPENAFNTISCRSFLAELYKNRDLHPIIPLVEMIYCVLFRPQLCFTHVRHGLVSYGYPIRRSSWAASAQLGDQHPPPEYWETVQRFFGDTKLFL